MSASKLQKIEIKNYSKEGIKNKVKRAINEFRKRDYSLLIIDSSERSIAHRLACYLEYEFKKDDYNVDCEYNRRKDQPKMIWRFWAKIKKSVLGKKVYPDIIVHQRGTNENNLLVIEIKKSSNKSQKERDFDLLKLKAYMHKGDEYQYKYALFMDFFVKENFKKYPVIQFFKDYREIDLESKYFGKI